MEYELHLTIKTPRDIELFKTTCSSLGVKPIIIETEKQGEFGQQVMISSKHRGEDYQTTLRNLYLGLVTQGFIVTRQKVEIYPGITKHPQHKYYESHLRLKLPKDFDRRDLEGACFWNNFHLSKNLFKQDNCFDYQMITYRTKEGENAEYDRFTKWIRNMIQFLEEKGIEYDKVEIEECILDTNMKIDESWINN